MSCAEAAEFERRFFARGGFGEREAIRRVGRGIAEEFLREFDIGNSPRNRDRRRRAQGRVRNRRRV